MYNVPKLASNVSQVQPLPTKYCANGGSLAMLSMSEVTKSMARIRHVVMAYRCPHEFKAYHMHQWHIGPNRPLIPLINGL